MPNDPKFLPLHPERKLLTGCRHVEVVPVYRASSPPYIPLYILGYPNVREVRRMGQPIALMCLVCDHWISVEDAWNAAVAKQITPGRGCVMNPGV